MTEADLFTVTTNVPEKPATTPPTNETLAAKPGDNTSEIKTTKDPVELKADDTASEPTDPIGDEPLEETDPEDPNPEDEKLETKTKEDPKPKKKNGFQRRVNKLNQEIEFWKSEAIKNQRPNAAPVKEEQVTAKTPDTGKPDKEKFATHDEYIEAVAEWKADQKFKAIQEEQRQNSLKEAAQRKQNEHFSRLEAFKESVDDFDDVWGSLKVPLTLAMSETIKESDLGPDLMYALAKDPKECARIAKLTPLAAARELGKLESKVSKSLSSDGDPKDAVKPEIIVKEPVVNPVRPRGATSKKRIDDPDISTDDYIRLRNAEERARYAR